MIGCGIEARDGAIGSVADLVVDDETWEITDVLVDSREWLPGKLLLISPQVIERIDWPRRRSTCASRARTSCRRPKSSCSSLRSDVA